LSRVKNGRPVSGFTGKGVSFDKSRNKWIAYLGDKFLGRFSTEKEALITRQKAVEVAERLK
jgi:hypothetical protein